MARPADLTDAEVAQAVRMHEAGATARQIVDALGLAVSDIPALRRRLLHHTWMKPLPGEVEPGRYVADDWDRALFEPWVERKARRAQERSWIERQGVAHG